MKRERRNSQAARQTPIRIERKEPMSPIILSSPDDDIVTAQDLIIAAEIAVMYLATTARAARFEVTLLGNRHDPRSCTITLAAWPAPPRGMWHWTVGITAPDGTPVAQLASHRYNQASPCLIYLNTAHADRIPAVLERLERITLPEVA